MDCSQSVSNILKKPRFIGSVKDLKIPGQKRKTTKRKERIMVRKACPIALRLHWKIMQRCRLNMVSVSTSTTWRRPREASPKIKTNLYGIKIKLVNVCGPLNVHLFHSHAPGIDKWPVGRQRPFLFIYNNNNNNNNTLLFIQVYLVS